MIFADLVSGDSDPCRRPATLGLVGDTIHRLRLFLSCDCGQNE
jgi:hypothetical protein